MGTKVKSHRIDDEAILLKHLSRNIKIPESLLSLNYKTHSNEADLTVAQKNTMTMGGNADHLHYHTGGGGGPQGIYTNQERDAQILKLSMMVNADIFGLDKAIVENLNDDSSIYRGYKVANAPILSTLTDNPSYLGSLKANQEYSYGVSYKNRHGQTNVVKVASTITGDGFNNAMNVQLIDVPSDNKGVSIYRTEGSTELQLVDETLDNWDNPHGLLCDTYLADKTSGLSSIVFTYDKSIDGNKGYISQDMQAVPDISVPLGTTPSVNVPFDYFLISSSRTSAYSLEILWDKTEPFAPRDYEVYYTTDTQVVDFEKANWKKFSQLEPHHTTYKTRCSFATDGKVTENYKITNNTRPENKFYINPVEGITYIRIRVTKIDNICRLTKVNLTDSEKSHRRHFYLDTEAVDFTPFNTIKFDYKTTGQHIPFKVEAARTDESVGSVVLSHDYPPSTFNNNYKEVRDGYILSRSYYNRTLSGSTYNRVRIGVKVAANSDVLAENFYLRLTNGGSWNVPGSGNVPFYNIPITFGGKPYLKCKYTVATEVWSDWVYLPSSSYTIYNAELVFKSVRGQLMYYPTNSYTYSKTDNSFIGKEDVSNEWFTDAQDTSRCIFAVQFGTTNSVSKNLSSGFEHSKWHKGYMDITSVNAIKHLKFFTGEVNTDVGSLVLDNFTVTKNKNILGPTVSSTNSISSGVVADVISDSFGLSKYKQVIFNQYATVENPQVVCFEFTAKQSINQINFTCLDRIKTPTNYVIQFTTDETATYDEPLSSGRWINFSRVEIGESSFDIGFQGTISGSRVIANNICNTVMAHRFDVAEVMKVRIWIEGTIDGGIPLINNIEIYDAVDSEEMKLIFDSSSPVSYPAFTLIDDGLTPKDIAPPKYNTTGSYNILWSKDKNLIEVIDKDSNAMLYTNIIPLSLFKDFMLTSQYLGDVTFEASFDDGDTFVPVALDIVNSLSTQSDSIIIRAALKNQATLHAFAMLYSL